MKRREFFKLGGAGLAGGLGAELLGAKPARAKARSKVVVVGGGFGGAIAAKYVKRMGSNIDVTLIERNKTYWTCPFSNLVISGVRPMDSIAFTYDELRDGVGINMVHDEVVGVDGERQTVRTKTGNEFEYDRLVMSPGIDFRYDRIQGYDETVAETIPHSWKAGPQTQKLRQQLEGMPDGGTFVLVAPPNPFRCPPGPPERASQVANYFKHNKPNSKVLIVDFKEGFSKQGLYQQAWQEMDYNIEWIKRSDWSTAMDAEGSFDYFEILADDKIVRADFEEIQADVINMIPPQKANRLADAAGLTDDSGWCPVEHKTFESTQVANIHVIGDAAIAGPMPKSGYAANSQAKICAASIVSALEDRPMERPSFVNTCYSDVGDHYGISVAMVYDYQDGQLVTVEGSGGLSPMDPAPGVRRLEAIYARGWYNAITQDMFRA